MLPQNIINQKIYLVIWFWFVFLIVVGVLQTLFEAVIIAVPAIRNRLLTWSMGQYGKDNNVQVFLNSRCNVADWFVLYQISKNTDKHFFFLLIGEISRTMFPQSVDTLPSNTQLPNIQNFKKNDFELTQRNHPNYPN